MKIKKLICLITLFLCLSNVFAAKNAYGTADEQTLELLNQVDELINQKQYATAFGKLSDEDNEYHIAKRIEIAINYFVQSIMHQMFCFKNLEENESLYEIRKNPQGNYNLTMYNPETVIQEFEEKHGERPILDYALGLYYCDITRRYPGTWLISDDELYQKGRDYLARACEKDCWDGWSLSELAWCYLRTKEYDNAVKIYSQKFNSDEYFSEDDEYNYGLACYYTNQYETAEEMFKKSAQAYKEEDNEDYLYDAYYLLLELYLVMGRHSDAQEYLDLCHSISTQDYRVERYAVILYAMTKNKEKLLEYSDKLFAFGPEKPSVSQMIAKEYFNYEVEEWLPEFFEMELAKPDNTTGTIQNLYFHYASSLSNMEKTDLAAQTAQKAKEAFEADGSLTPEIQEMLEGMGLKP